jgi:ribosomal protein S18 acetylase RimI-like enzyme
MQDLFSPRLGTTQDAAAIARMSRDYVEHGLGWSWNPARVLRAIRDPATNVVVAPHSTGILGFGIMLYGEETAHLALLAVHPANQRRGLGSHLVAWFEKSAGVAGIRHIHVEARADNLAAIAFYRALNFTDVGLATGYYQGILDAVRLQKELTQLRSAL